MVLFLIKLSYIKGLVPVCIRPPHPHNLQITLPTVRMIVDVSKAVAVISTSALIKLLKCKEASLRIDAKVNLLLISIYLL